VLASVRRYCAAQLHGLGVAAGLVGHWGASLLQKAAVEVSAGTAAAEAADTAAATAAVLGT
jgi:hypothetical protein